MDPCLRRNTLSIGFESWYSTYYAYSFKESLDKQSRKMESTLERNRMPPCQAYSFPYEQSEN